MVVLTLHKDKFGFSLDDYFLNLFENKLPLKIKKPASEEKELTLIEKLIAHLRNRNDSTSSSVRSILERSFSYHKQIVSDIDRKSNPVGFSKFKSECRSAIKLLSDAVAFHANLSVNGIEFWNDFWHYPDSLDSFLKVLETQSSEIGLRTRGPRWFRTVTSYRTLKYHVKKYNCDVSYIFESFL